MSRSSRTNWTQGNAHAARGKDFANGMLSMGKAWEQQAILEERLRRIDYILNNSDHTRPQLNEMCDDLIWDMSNYILRSVR